MSEVSSNTVTTRDTNPTTATVNTLSNTWRSSLRSPFVGFNEVFNAIIPVHEKGLKSGFYNSIALIFLMFVIIIIYFCYWILRPFLQPLVWAILCGSALHPFKRKLLLYSENWIKDLKSDCRPITVGTILLPFYIINNIVDSMLKFFQKYWKIILFIGLFIFFKDLSADSLLTVYNFGYNLMENIIHLISIVLSYLTNCSNTLAITLTIAYLTALSFGWSESTHQYLTFCAPFVSMFLFIHMISRIGTLGHILIVIVISIILIGLTKTLITAQSQSSPTDQIDGLAKIKTHLYSFAMTIISLCKTKENEESIDINDGKRDQNVLTDIQKEFASVGTSPMPQTIARSDTLNDRNSSIATNTENKYKSNSYLYAVLWAVVLVQIWSHRYLICLVLIPVILKSLTMGWTYIWNLIFNNIHRFSGFIQKRRKALFHPLIRNSYNYFLIGDKVIIDTIETSLNGLTSLSIICITIVSILFATIFMSIQIYGESLHLIDLMSNVFNATISYYPESTQLLPESFNGMHGMLDEVVRNGYEYGREYIKNFIRNALNVDTNENKTKVVEKQILEIWDRAYHLWLIRNTNETDIFPKKGPYDFDKLYNALKTLDLTLCFNIVKENIDTLISVFDSVWLLLKGNVTLLFTAIAAVFSTLLGGGLGLMNLVFSFIIFTTALFYLLSASGEYYKPVELVNRIFPSEVKSQQTSGSNPTNGCIYSKFGCAVEEAINGVFAASIKMSVFYGLNTWLIHTIFDVNFVFIPSVMAAVLGAVPFLSAFWASFPAFLELFFVQSQRTKAVLLLVSAYFPSFFVDTTIYSEIKSGHPYLTGLAIAGGVFYLGFEGALFGPIILCCLFVAFNMYSSIMQESTGSNTVGSTVSTINTMNMTPHSTVKPSDKFFRQQSII